MSEWADEVVERPHWRACAEALVDRIVEHDDDMGDLANSTADELRDALRVAAERLRKLTDPDAALRVVMDAAGVEQVGWIHPTTRSFRYTSVEPGEPYQPVFRLAPPTPEPERS